MLNSTSSGEKSWASVASGVEPQHWKIINIVERENGCKFYHPTETCKYLSAKKRNVSIDLKRNVNMHCDKCRFHSKCEYLHQCSRNIYRQNPEIVDLERELSVLSKEISQSNFLAKVQMPEIENLIIEN